MCHLTPIYGVLGDPQGFLRARQAAYQLSHALSPVPIIHSLVHSPVLLCYFKSESAILSYPDRITYRCSPLEVGGAA